jgi:hypothetical protein
MYLSFYIYKKWSNAINYIFILRKVHIPPLNYYLIVNVLSKLPIVSMFPTKL